MTFTVHKATVADAASIAKLFSSNEEGEFERLQRGTCSVDGHTDHLEKRVSEIIAEGDELWCVVKDDESGQVMSVAEWQLPKTEPEKPKSDEEKAAAEEEWYKRLPDGMNQSLLLEYRRKIHALRDVSKKDRPTYTLANIATRPEYQRRGAASALIRWVFQKADKEKRIVYLDTSADDTARHLYEGLGFVKTGEASFDLIPHGGSGTHVHIAMVREPQ